MSDQSVVTVETLKRRAYIGGLSKSITEDDLKNRFGSFGVISKIDIVRDPSTGECRGFAFIIIESTTDNWKKCMSLFNGAKWKGMTLKIQDAKPDYKQRQLLREEWEKQKALNDSSLVPKKRRCRYVDTMFAEDMSLVTDNNVHERKSKYGRAVAIMHIRRDDGTKLMVDP
ncbi:2384_t:CDS:2, partial [Scutellospora calospora]